MCLMLYIGTSSPVVPSATRDLLIEPVAESRRAVEQWFSRPAVRFVGAHTGCSCGFPSVMAETPVEYYQGMPLDSDDRAADLRSVRALLALLGTLVTPAATVELYPIADGDEARSPKGVVEWQIEQLEPERLFFNEGFLHVVRRA